MAWTGINNWLTLVLKRSSRTLVWVRPTELRSVAGRRSTGSQATDIELDSQVKWMLRPLTVSLNNKTIERRQNMLYKTKNYLKT